MKSIFEFLTKHAEQTPDRFAILSSENLPLIYRTLAEQVNSTICYLRREGISPKDRVAVVLPEGMSGAVACLSIMSGAACAPLNPNYTAYEFEVLLKKLDACAVLTDKSDKSPIRGVATSMGLKILDWENSLTLPGDGAAASPETDDIALLLFTSGTSASPKLVPLSHRNISTSAYSIAATLELTSEDRCQFAMPLHHIHGLSTLFSTIASGGSFVAMPGFSPENFLACLTEFRPTWYSASPTVHRAILEQVHFRCGDTRDTGLRFIRSASAAMPAQLIREMEETFGVPFVEAYGMTEASPQIAANRLPPFPCKIGSVGTSAGPEIGIMDKDGILLPPNTTGEIVIRGDNVTDGYENDADVNRASFTNGWLRTGDLGHLDADGYLFITGRLKEIINRGGEKISPPFVEGILLEHPAIQQAAVFAVAHPVLGESVAAAVVLRPFFQESILRARASTARQQQYKDEILEYASTRLAHFEVPQNLYFVDEIPVGQTGKIIRSELTKHFELSHISALKTSGADALNQPRTVTESRVADLFANVLKIPLPAIHDKFFELGGDSLSALQLIARVEDIFQIRLPHTSLFEHPTPAQLAEFIGQQLADLVADGKLRVSQDTLAPFEKSATLSNEHRGLAPASFTQEQAFIIDQLGAGSAYNISAPLWLSGQLCERTLFKVLNEICRRHDSLRTTFQFSQGGLRQVILPPQKQLIDNFNVIDAADLIEDGFTGGDHPTGANENTQAKLRSAALQYANAEAAKTFDLTSGALLRAKLMRVADDEHLLLLVMHHIISDGWSTGIFYRELKELYNAFVQGQISPLGELSCQFGDFAVWQRRRLTEGRVDDQIAYWKKQLAEISAECTFPADRPRQRNSTYRGAIVETPIAAELVQGLKQVGKSCNATAFMTFLAAFKTLLFRHNSQTDCAVGTPVANRARKEFESLIGFFANTLVLRTDMTGDPTFLDLLERVRVTSLAAADNQEVPLEHLVDELQLERDASCNSLFQVMFAFQNLHSNYATVGSTGVAPGKSFALTDGLIAKPFRIDNETSKFDVTLYISETDEGMKATWQYNSDLYREETITSLASQFQTLLAAITAAPTRRISELPLVSDADTQALIADLKGSEKKRQFKNSFVELFEHRVAQTPVRIAVIDGDKQWTYCQLNERANQFAHRLQSLGVDRDKLVGVCLPRSAEWLAVILGIWKTGRAYLPLDPEYPAHRLEAMMRKSTPGVIVGYQSHLDSIRSSHDGKLICLDADEEISRQLKDNPQLNAKADDLAYVMFTSGSNGEPRGVMVTHGNVCHYAQSMVEAIGVEAEDRFLHTASFAFSSSVRQFTLPLACGAACVISSAEERRNPIMLFEMVERKKVTIVDLVPSHWMSCLAVLRSLPSSVRSNLGENSLRLVLSASEPLPSSVAREWNSLFKRDIKRINMYGQTETSGIVTVYTISDEDELSTVVPIGKPIANTRAFVLDEFDRQVPVGKVGELFIGGSGVALGYLNDTEATSCNFVLSPFGDAPERLYRTGDLARYRADGTIEFVGRTDRLVKVRGHRVEPIEVENILCSFPEVSEAAVVAVKDADKLTNSEQTMLRAFITVVPNARVEMRSLTQVLRELVRERLPEHFVPSTISVLDQMPRTSTGKIDRIELATRSSEASGAQQSGAPISSDTAPVSRSIFEVESTLKQVWRSVLKLDEVRSDENFFDIGGNSLLAVNVMVSAEALGLRFSLMQFYENQTIAELSAVISRSTSPSTSLLAETTKEPAKASFASSSNAPKDITVKVRSSAASVLVTADSLRSFGIEALTRAGLVEAGARIVSEVQLEASLRGQPTHNMISIPRYGKRLTAGKLNANPIIRVENETSVMAQIDGDNGPGQWVSTVAMDIALEKAKESGVGIAVARRSNHFGAAGHYVWEATKRGFIGLCTTNGPLILAPTGGATPTFGNNPLAVGIPSQEHAPILLDMAMSVATRGKIGLSIAEGNPLAHGWILDRFGRSSIELADLAAGLGVPIGGHKGYGLALVMEVLAGVLSGSGFCSDHSRSELHQSSLPDYGHFFLALDPARFMPAEEFLTRVDRLIEQTKSGELAEGVSEIFVPGEMEMRARERSLKEGVRMRASAYRALLAYAKDADLETELQLAQVSMNA